MAASNVSYLTATIAVGASLSNALDLGGRVPCAASCPAAMEGTAFTFQGSVDGSTFFNLFDDAGNEYSVVVAASRVVILKPDYFAGLRQLKVRTGTNASPTVQAGADTAILIAIRSL